MHGAVASQVLGPARVAAALDDATSADLPTATRATLVLLGRMTTSPGDVGPADITAVREAGASDGAILDALYVCFIFNLIDRVADALDFTVPSPEECDRGARVLLRFGYRI